MFIRVLPLFNGKISQSNYVKFFRMINISSYYLCKEVEPPEYPRYIVKKEVKKDDTLKKVITMQWQRKALFGPLLKTKSQKASEMKIRRLKIGKKVVKLDDTPQSVQFVMSKPPPTLGIDDIEHDIALNSEVIGDKDTVDFPMMNLSRNKTTQINPQEDQVTSYSYPSVTKILQETMSEQSKLALEKWKNSMIESLGEEGFAKYQQELFKNGRNLHQSIVDLLEGKDPETIEISTGNEGHWKSLETVFPKIKDVKVLEQPVCHPVLQYKGVVDCVAVYRNKLLVIDWKTSKKLKSSINSTFDNPIQVVAYLGALNYDKRFNLDVDNAAIVVAYENGRPAHTHVMDRNMCFQYWKKWLERLHKYRTILNAK